MDYRQELEKYYEYLGDVRPAHKMITNHMLYFADWLNENALQPDASKDSKSSVGCLYWETVDGVGGCMFD